MGNMSLLVAVTLRALAIKCLYIARPARPICALTHSSFQALAAKVTTIYMELKEKWFSESLGYNNL
jgi:hypothetical protein